MPGTASHDAYKYWPGAPKTCLRAFRRALSGFPQGSGCWMRQSICKRSTQTLSDASIILRGYGCTSVELAGKIKRGDVGLRKNNWKVRTTFSPELQAFLSSRDDWFEYLAEFRHALGHKIPLYIPPGCVRPKDVDAYNDLERRMGAAMAAIRPAEYDRLLEEQKKLHIFQPITTHSFKEATGTIRFHQQVLVDFLTVEELALKMLAELKSYQSSQKPPNSYSSGMGADDCKRPSK